MQVCSRVSLPARGGTPKDARTDSGGWRNGKACGWSDRRRHDKRASSYGLYALKDWKTRQLVSEPGVRDDHALTLDEVERYLMTGSPR